MVLLAMTAAAWIVGGKPPGRAAMLAVPGAAGVIAGAVALNQRLERLSDAKMSRTADRPLPSGRLSSRQATWFGVCTSLGGFAWLGFLSSPLVVAMAAGSWLVYVWVYTPLKSITIWQTPIGAAAGATPILLGAAAVGEPGSPTAWVLFAVAFFWQFPHAMAVAWLYRRQFAEAAVKVAPVVDPSGLRRRLDGRGGRGGDSPREPGARLDFRRRLGLRRMRGGPGPGLSGLFARLSRPSRRVGRTAAFLGLFGLLAAGVARHASCGRAMTASRHFQLSMFGAYWSVSISVSERNNAKKTSAVTKIKA